MAAPSSPAPHGSSKARIEGDTDQRLGLTHGAIQLGRSGPRHRDGRGHGRGPEKLLLDAVATLKHVVELLGKESGQIKPEPLVQVDRWWSGTVDVIESLGKLEPSARAAGEDGAEART